MQKRRILMCLEQLDIGGVETAVVTLCKGYIRAGHKVFVAAADGTFSKQLDEMGIQVLNIKYDIVNHYVLEQKEELKRFCTDNKITEIHFHQYPCLLYFLPVCVDLNIPYYAYVHSIIPGTPQYFMRDYPVFCTAIPFFLQNASSIICIAESTKNELENLFELGDERYQIIPNSLNLSDFENTRKVEKIEKFGIISRLSEEKYISITKGIDFFAQYNKEHKNATLSIVGDGPIFNKLKKYAEQYENITFLGKMSNVSPFIESIDVLMGVDRCILEAIASKRVAIICGYNGHINIVKKENIAQASQTNFSGNNLANNDSSLEELNSISQKEYKKLVEENYKYIEKKYSVDNNLLKEPPKKIIYSQNDRMIFENINKLIISSDKLFQKRTCIPPTSKLKKCKNIIRRVYKKMKKIWE